MLPPQCLTKDLALGRKAKTKSDKVIMLNTNQWRDVLKCAVNDQV